MPARPIPLIPDGAYASQIDHAVSESGWPSSDYAEFLQALVSATTVIATVRWNAVQRLEQLGVEVEHPAPSIDAEASAETQVDTLAIIRQLFAAGTEDDVIADLLGLSQTEVAESYTSGRLGFPRHQKLKSILRLNALGYIGSEIAEQLGVSRAYVSKMLKLADARIPNTEPVAHRHYDEILRLWEEGYTAAWIARHLGDDVTTSNVDWIIRRARSQGIPVRQRRRSKVEAEQPLAEAS